MSIDDGDRTVADFTALDGVSKKAAKALVRVGVTSMSQLARANVYDLAERLDEIGAPVPVGRIISQRWLFQAWDQAKASEPGRLDEDLSSAADVVDEPVDEPEWVEQASFIVSFDRRTGHEGPVWQTRIWDNQVLDEHVVGGFDPDDWAEVIVERVEPPES